MYVSADKQVAIMQAWASGVKCDFLTTDGSIENKFRRLANVKGWDDKELFQRWEMLFEEDILDPSAPAPILPSESANSVGGDVEDLAEDMRELSVLSQASSYTVVSSASDDVLARVRSLDSEEGSEESESLARVRSLDSEEEEEARSDSVSSSQNGQLVPNNTEEASRQDSLDSNNSVHTCNTADLNNALQSLKLHWGIADNRPALQQEHHELHHPTPPNSNPEWDKLDPHEHFVHDPTAPFLFEFSRVSCCCSWSTSRARGELISLLASEVNFFYPYTGNAMTQWRQICKDVGLAGADDYKSVTQCKKALRTVKVNLFHLIDYKRNPDVGKAPLKTFSSWGKLRQSVRETGRFPKQCAKAGGGFIAPLLKVL
ncbi:transcription factor Zn C2H2 [Pyrenophora seminiperda CCB06]|uniref:Transcription factor Zn C2H2 n=1 Tax=Pyrenophora seminiperda CCB06 TaxID=1302712 RepID=A0A3M7MAH2_9PLEO|nr:transcription factor Zn C2H2 [Pyrenophora seminiperda CCB06]